MTKHEEEICANAVQLAVLAERTRWKECIEKIKQEISERSHHVKMYEFGGSYTDGKLAAHDYDLLVIDICVREMKG